MRIDKCYRYETLEFQDVLFPGFTTVLLTMEGSARRGSYMRQLNEFRPTERVLIQHNMGFKKCVKPDWVKTTALDLWHANIKAFSEVDGPILLLEDDVEFLPDVREAAAAVLEVVNTSGVDCYSLGSASIYLSYPVGQHLRVLLGGDAHAMMYTKQGIQKLRDVHVRYLHDIETIPRINTYTFKTPLATQRRVATENSQLWDPTGFFVKMYEQLDGNEFYISHSCGLFGGQLLVLCVVFILAFKL